MVLTAPVAPRLRIVLLGKMAAWCEPHMRALLRVPHEITVIRDPREVDRHEAELARAEVIAGWPLRPDILDRCPNLRLVQVTGAGIDGLDLDRIPPGVFVCNMYNHEAAIAEYILMAMLILTRQPFEYDARLRRGNWDNSCIWGETPVLRELRGQNLLLIGLGSIARETAARAAAFGMNITGVSRRTTSFAHARRVVPMDQLDEAIAEADFVVPTCALTKETAGLIGERQYARMKSTAFVVNIARGRILDERATYEALRDRRIAGAAIDVWYRYPDRNVPDGAAVFPSEHPFHELPNVLLSPHNSGWTMNTILGRAADLADNINRLGSGETPLRRVR